MEITQIDRENAVLEESLETSFTDTDVVVNSPAPSDEAGGTADPPDVEPSEALPSEPGSVEEVPDGENILEESHASGADDILGDDAGPAPALPSGDGSGNMSLDIDEGGDDIYVEEEGEASPSPTLPLSEPLAVYIVEEEEEAVPYDLGGVYPGTISGTYLDYFSGIADKLGFNEHYVAFRSGQYEYTMAWGFDLAYDGYRFQGDVLDYCRIYRVDSRGEYFVEFGSDSVNLTPGTGFVYSDLAGFATLTEGGTRLEFSTLLFAVGFAVVYSVCHDIFDYVMQYVYRK